MTPDVAVRIVDKDATGPGLDKAGRKLSAFQKRAQGLAKEGGLERIGRQADGLKKLGGMSFAFDRMGGSLAGISNLSGGAAQNVATLTRGLLTLRGASTGVAGAMAEDVALATGAAAGLVVAAAGVGVAGYMLGDKWAKAGQDLYNTSAILGVLPRDLQAARGAAARFGVTGEQVDNAYEGLSNTLYDAKYGANNLALGAMNQLGIKLKTNADGATDYADAMDQVADAIARQKDPAVQRKLASVFGVSSMLPALRRGSGAIKAQRDDYLKSGPVLSDAEIAQSDAVRQKSVALRQRLGNLEKTAGVAAEKFTGGVAGFGNRAAGGDLGGAISRGATDLARSGSEAARQLVEGAREAARSIAGAGGGAGGGADRRAQAMAFFTGRGWTPAQAAGIVANLQHESAFRANAVGDSGSAYGIAQWHKDRQRAFAAWSGHDIRKSSFEEQLAFVDHELTQGAYRAAGAKLRGARGADESGAIVSRDYERPKFADAEAQARGRTAEAVAAATPAKAHVEVVFRNAPAGTSTSVAADPGVQVNVARSLEGIG